MRLEVAKHLCLTCMVHRGFLDVSEALFHHAIEAVEAALVDHPTYRVVLAGHSLGAAIALLTGAHFRILIRPDLMPKQPIDIFAYGSPRVGNEDFVNTVDAQPGHEYRITHLNDPVPRVPLLRQSYRHTPVEYWLFTGDATTLDYHAEEVKVCLGTSSVECVGSYWSGSKEAHVNYLVLVNACRREAKRRRREAGLEETGFWWYWSAVKTFLATLWRVTFPVSQMADQVYARSLKYKRWVPEAVRAIARRHAALEGAVLGAAVGL
jgi:pimeloyl-ACP methyl ester carboxylesterase